MREAVATDSAGNDCLLVKRMVAASACTVALALVAGPLLAAVGEGTFRQGLLGGSLAAVGTTGALVAAALAIPGDNGARYFARRLAVAAVAALGVAMAVLMTVFH